MYSFSFLGLVRGFEPLGSKWSRPWGGTDRYNIERTEETNKKLGKKL